MTLARTVADAVLYEGYMLYPYRPSATKNRQRWSFGILYPPTFPEVCSGTERSIMHSECLIEAEPDVALQVQLRFLHLLSRHFQTVDSTYNASIPESGEEGSERTVNFDLPLLTVRQSYQFSFPESDETELLRDAAGEPLGTIRRTQHELSGFISVHVETVRGSIFKLTIEIVNTTPLSEEFHDRSAALFRSLLSAHTILSASKAQFVSLLDPPAELRDAVDNCKNVGNFPVLIGAYPERDMLLCSPIILYDYPQIAPESASDFYDATEMDEMLTLRVMTLTNEEKNEMRRADDRVRQLLERTEQTAREQLMRTHGTIRNMRPASEKP